jgi:hypothetical protein
MDTCRRGSFCLPFLCAFMQDSDSALIQLPEVQKIRSYLHDKGLVLPESPVDVQQGWCVPFIRWVAAHATSGVEATLQVEDAPGIRIGTHRDIVCDPALYNLARFDAGLPTTHIVLGSNLARLPWVKSLLVSNKAIFIDRSLTGRAALEQHISLSQTISDIVDNGGHVWIAQAPGRAKDGRDETSVALLKMLAKARGGDELGPKALANILRPIAIRYDVNPCDGLLIKERLIGTKDKKDDERSMKSGLEGWKGVVRIAEGATMCADQENSREGWAAFARSVDHAIVALDIHGQWAHEAKTALSRGDNSGLSAGFKDRIAKVGQKLEQFIGPVDEAKLTTMMCEVYREGTTR